MFTRTPQLLFDVDYWRRGRLGQGGGSSVLALISYFPTEGQRVVFPSYYSTSPYPVFDRVRALGSVL